MIDETVAPVQESEDVRVRRWRTLRFLDLGFSMVESELLAGTGVDYRAAAKLLKNGCPLRVAFDVLL